MGYSFRNRLGHAGRRFSEVNSLCMTYIAGTNEFPVNASPILMNADEVSPGISSITRVEVQSFAIDRCSIESVYPPRDGHKLRNEETGEIFAIKSRNVDDPPYVHVTSQRDRVIVHTIRTNR